MREWLSPRRGQVTGLLAGTKETSALTGMLHFFDYNKKRLEMYVENINYGQLWGISM